MKQKFQRDVRPIFIEVLTAIPPCLIKIEKLISEKASFGVFGRKNARKDTSGK